MRKVFASDRLSCRAVAAIMAREASAHHKVVEGSANLRPYRRARMTVGTSGRGGQDVGLVAARGVHTIVALFAGLANHTGIAVVEGQDHRQPDRRVVAVLAIHRCRHMGYGLALGQLAIVARNAGGCSHVCVVSGANFMKLANNKTPAMIA